MSWAQKYQIGDLKLKKLNAPKKDLSPREIFGKFPSLFEEIMKSNSKIYNQYDKKAYLVDKSLFVENLMKTPSSYLPGSVVKISSILKKTLKKAFEILNDATQLFKNRNYNKFKTLELRTIKK